MCQSLFVNKVSDLQVFSSEFCEISKNTFFYRTPLGDCFWSYESQNTFLEEDQTPKSPYIGI